MWCGRWAAEGSCATRRSCRRGGHQPLAVQEASDRRAFLLLGPLAEEALLPSHAAIGHVHDHGYSTLLQCGMGLGHGHIPFYIGNSTGPLAHDVLPLSMLEQIAMPYNSALNFQLSVT
jgi:hypothetical protein